MPKKTASAYPPPPENMTKDIGEVAYAAYHEVSPTKVPFKNLTDIEKKAWASAGTAAANVGIYGEFLKIKSYLPPGTDLSGGDEFDPRGSIEEQDGPNV